MKTLQTNGLAILVLFSIFGVSHVLTTCSDTHPVSCPRYDLCCAMHEFCHKTRGYCDTCFPEHFTTQEQKLQFCHDFQFEAVTKMRRPSCIGACDSLFGRDKFFMTTCNATHPISCPPKNKCCAMDHFCNETRRDCDSCFPEDYNTLEQQLQFCQEFQFEAVSKMRHPSCAGACIAKFGIEKLFFPACNATHPVSCPPKNKCCAVDHFCNETRRDCDPCFPENYNTRERQLQFCQEFQNESVLKMRHPLCVAACFAKFGKKAFFEAPETTCLHYVLFTFLGHNVVYVFVIICLVFIFIYKRETVSKYFETKWQQLKGLWNKKRCDEEETKLPPCIPLAYRKLQDECEALEAYGDDQK